MKKKHRESRLLSFEASKHLLSAQKLSVASGMGCLKPDYMLTQEKQEF